MREPINEINGLPSLGELSDYPHPLCVVLATAADDDDGAGSGDEACQHK